MFSILLIYTGQLRTWIIGDSIIKGAGFKQKQLRGGGRVFWDGISGARIAGVATWLRDIRRPFPTTIIIHLGTNDIFSTPLLEVRERIELTLSGVRNFFPLTRIIWSLIIPRNYFHHQKRRGAGAGCARTINNHAIRICRSSMPNTHVIGYGKILPVRFSHLFRYDGLHLSKEGDFVFKQHLEQALLFFNAYPEEFEFPKKDCV